MIFGGGKKRLSYSQIRDVKPWACHIECYCGNELVLYEGSITTCSRCERQYVTSDISIWVYEKEADD